MVDEKTLRVLEFEKITHEISAFASFSASAELAGRIKPARTLEDALLRMKTNSEARFLLASENVSLQDATDIRPYVRRAAKDGVLHPQELLQVKRTLTIIRDARRQIDRYAGQLPHLTQVAGSMAVPAGLVDAITRSISEDGEVLDSASPLLGTIRSEMKAAHSRLMGKLDKIISDPKNASVLQEAIITQRNGRYVIPLRSECKGRIRGLVHDQSASGVTLFIEPLVIVDLNNEVTEYQLAEKEEERKILAALSAQIGAVARPVYEAIEALARIDLALMCAKYAEKIHAVEPDLVDFRRTAKNEIHPGSILRLFQARHPLIDPQHIVPVDLVLDQQTYALIITGPNTGGKTVTLKTAGLLALMAQAGLHIPVAPGSSLSFFSRIFADIGDEQSIEQSLSTFSGHIRNIIFILRHADRRSLVLFDELGAGTDPQEGSALARAIVKYLLEKKITSLTATHYPELKTLAYTWPGAKNASLEFNEESLQPTYRLTIGLPGRSNALIIAEKLGLNNEIIMAAREIIPVQHVEAEKLLKEIDRQKIAARRERAAEEQARSRAETLKNELEKRLNAIEEERETLLEQSRRQAEDEFSEIQQEIVALRKALQKAKVPLDEIRTIQSHAEEISASAGAKTALPAFSRPRPKFRAGEKVLIRSLGMQAVISSIEGDDIEIMAGSLRMRTRMEDIRKLNEPEEEEKGKPEAEAVRRGAGPSIIHPSPGMQLDIRGQRAEDALQAVTDYLDSASLAGLPYVNIIHGKGTGRLRDVIRQALRQSPHVRSIENGLQNEGGDGVTIAHLVEA